MMGSRPNKRLEFTQAVQVYSFLTNSSSFCCRIELYERFYFLLNSLNLNF